ncbi:MAG: hypothetical protein ACRC5T_13465 [Cetobacterium sp.]
MNIKNYIYILKTRAREIKLHEYIKILNENKNKKSEIIEIFFLKFNEDYISSIELLLQNEKMYSASLNIVSAIDVLAKHYSDDKGGVGDRYGRFLEKYFTSLKKFLNEDKIDKSKDEFYNNFRCGIVHSNSSVIDFTLDDEISKFTKQDGRKVINLTWLFKELKRVLEEYKTNLETDESVYTKFLTIEKNLYCNQIKKLK